MKQSPPHEMDAVERMVNRVLGAGVAVSVAFMLAGVVLVVARGGGLPPHAPSFRELAPGLGTADPAAYLSTGLLVLIATPFARVAGSVIVFALERDRRYVALTTVVLLVMCAGVLLGRAG